MIDETNKTAAERAFKGLFRRLARVAIEAGLTAPMAHRLLKEALVETAEADFTLDGKRLTDSRISVLTGVHRKDIRAFRAEAGPDDGAGSGQRMGIVSTVMGRWIGDPDLIDEVGNPLPLPRHAEGGPSFDALVESVTSDVRPRTLLDELVRNGSATVDAESDTVSLTRNALISAATLDDGLFFLDRNVGDHVAALAHNITADQDQPPMIERAVFYNHLRPEDVDSLQAYSRERSVGLLEDLNRRALAMQTQAAQSDMPKDRFRFGVYFYREPSGGPDREASE